MKCRGTDEDGMVVGFKRISVPAWRASGYFQYLTPYVHLYLTRAAAPAL